MNGGEVVAQKLVEAAKTLKPRELSSADGGGQRLRDAVVFGCVPAPHTRACPTCVPTYHAAAQAHELAWYM